MSAPTSPDAAAALGPALVALRGTPAAPLVVQLVDSAPTPGSRPVLAAGLARDVGLSSVIVLVTSEVGAAHGTVDGIPVLTVPVGSAYRALAAADGLDADRLASWIESRDQALALGGRAATGDTRSRARWAATRRSLLDRAAVPERTTRTDASPAGRWRRSPTAADLELAVATAVDGLAPAIVQAYGATRPAALRAVELARLRGDGVRLVLDLALPMPTADQLAAADGLVAPTSFAAAQTARGAVALTGPHHAADLPSATLARLALAPHEQLVAVRWAADRAADVSTVVRALAHLPGTHVLVYGTRSGPALTAMLADAQRRGLRGRLHTTPDAGASVLHGAAVTVVVPTDDAVPADLLESVALGIPVVSPSTPVVRRMLEAEPFGLLHDGTTDGLVAALRTVLGAATYREVATRLSRDGASWSQQRSDLAALYAGLLPSGGPTLRSPAEPADHDVAGPAPAVATTAADAGPEVRLGIGPANYAGQAAAWAGAVRDRLGVDARAFGDADVFAFPFDDPRRTVAPGDHVAGAAQAAWLLGSYTHVLLDGFVPVTGGFVPGGTEGELDFLRRHGRVVGAICHGTEIRDPDRHMARIPQSYYARAPREWTARVRAIVQGNAAALARLGVPVLVSTPDLLLDVPTATWLPVVVDVEGWAGTRPVLADAVPRVLHAPSRSVPPIKGTELVEPALRSLHDEGLIEYVSAENLPHARMRELVSSVDVVVDQVVSGYYGVAAVEGMANGRLVVGYVADDVRALVADPVPVVDVHDGDVASTVREVLADRGRFTALAATGPGFARRWHDGQVSADVLARFLEHPQPQEGSHP